MAFNLDALLLAIHLLAASAWFGAGWYDRLMVVPAIHGAGASGIEVIKETIRRGGGAKWFAPASLLTVISGGVLYWRLGTDFSTTAGIMVTLGAALGIIALLTGIFLHAPTEKHLKAAVEADNAADIRRHAHHLERHTTISAGLVTVAFLLMALRYVVV